jgi:cobalt-precorrin 5A hydrolase
MIAAGIGCRRGTPVEEIEFALKAAQAAFGIADRDITVLATVTSKASEPSLGETAKRLGIPLQAYPPDLLETVSSKVASPSMRVLDLVGVASVAEASALVAVGRNGRLLGPRVATATVTCALAEGDGPVEQPEDPSS